MTLFNKSRSHYTAALLRNGGWLYFDGKFKNPHTQPLTDLLPELEIQDVFYLKQFGVRLYRAP